MSFTISHYTTTYDQHTGRYDGPLRTITRRRRLHTPPAFLPPCPRGAERLPLRELGGYPWATPEAAAAAYVGLFGRQPVRGAGEHSGYRTYTARELELVADALLDPPWHQ